MITAGYVNQISIFAHLWAQLSAKVLISLKHVGKFLQMWDMIILQSHPYQQHHNHHCHQDTWIRKRRLINMDLDKKETSGWGNPLPGVDAAVEEQHRIWSFWTAMSIITTTTWTFGETAVLRKWTISLIRVQFLALSKVIGGRNHAIWPLEIWKFGIKDIYRQGYSTSIPRERFPICYYTKKNCNT